MVCSVGCIVFNITMRILLSARVTILCCYLCNVGLVTSTICRYCQVDLFPSIMNAASFVFWIYSVCLFEFCVVFIANIVMRGVGQLLFSTLFSVMSTWHAHTVPFVFDMWFTHRHLLLLLKIHKQFWLDVYVMIQLTQQQELLLKEVFQNKIENWFLTCRKLQLNFR